MTHAVEGTSTDFTSAIDTERVPEPDLAVIAGGGKPLAIRMDGQAPGGSLVGRPELGQSAAGLCIPPVQHSAAVNDRQGHAVGQIPVMDFTGSVAGGQ